MIFLKCDLTFLSSKSEVLKCSFPFNLSGIVIIAKWCCVTSQSRTWKKMELLHHDSWHLLLEPSYYAMIKSKRLNIQHVCALADGSTESQHQLLNMTVRIQALSLPSWDPKTGSETIHLCWILYKLITLIQNLWA
jgi:hypothetical protein